MGGNVLVMLQGMQIMSLTREAFGNILPKEASFIYDNYGLVSMYVLGLEVEGTTKDIEWVWHKCFESRLE